MKMADAMRSFAALHAEALIEVLGEAGTHLLLSQLAKHMEELAAYAISSYVGAVQEALPSNSKLPNHQYGARLTSRRSSPTCRSTRSCTPE